MDQGSILKGAKQNVRLVQLHDIFKTLQYSSGDPGRTGNGKLLAYDMGVGKTRTFVAANGVLRLIWISQWHYEAYKHLHMKEGTSDCALGNREFGIPCY